MNYRGYKLGDEIVVDSLSGVSSVCQTNYGVAGGIGIALYCYKKGKELLRNTDDVDVSLYPQLTFSKFKEYIGYALCTYLEELGYNSKIGKPSTAHEIGIRKGGEPFFLHFSKRTRKFLKRFKERIVRELKNVYEVEIPKKNEKILVLRPEDLIPPKLHRGSEKDLYDISLIARCGPDLDWEYLDESLTWWALGEEKIVDDDKKAIKEIIEASIRF